MIYDISNIYISLAKARAYFRREPIFVIAGEPKLGCGRRGRAGGIRAIAAYFLTSGQAGLGGPKASSPGMWLRIL